MIFTTRFAVFHIKRVIEKIEDETRNKAATVIQAHFRGFAARQAHLPRHLSHQYRCLCQKSKEELELTRAEAGVTPVYLPQEMPQVVLKASGKHSAVKRFEHMQDVRAVLKSQKCSHLIIPKANLSGPELQFLVEERLPINPDHLYNYKLYISEPALFDEAVREMVRLFSKIIIQDLLKKGYDLVGHIDGIDLVCHIDGIEDYIRYDNLPLFIVERNGKREGNIGLIDLDKLDKNPTPESLAKNLEVLARIFPYHLEIIKEEAIKNNIFINKKALQIAAEKGMRYIQIGIIDYQTWREEQSLPTSLPIFQVTEKRIEELSLIIEKRFLKLKEIDEMYNEPGADKIGFLCAPEEVEASSKEFARHYVTRVISKLQEEVERCQQEKWQRMPKKERTESEMVSLRSLEYCDHFSYIPSLETCINENKKIHIPPGEMIEISGYLFDEIMKSLEGHEIFDCRKDPELLTCFIRF